MKTKNVDMENKRTQVFSFRLTLEELDKLQSLAGRYDMSPQDFVRDLVRFIVGDKVQEGSDFAKSIGKILAQKHEEFSIFSQIIADTTSRLTSDISQVTLFKGKTKSARKYRKQKQS
jgi:hypothetical protein